MSSQHDNHLPRLLLILACAGATSACAAPGPLNTLIVGNSITYHGPATNIGWNGRWGMAATRQDADYASQVNLCFAQSTGAAPRATVKNLAAFERGETELDFAKDVGIPATAKLNLALIELGDNAPEADIVSGAFAARYDRLINAVRERLSPNGQLICLGTWWTNPKKDDVIAGACARANGVFVSLNGIAATPGMKAAAERQVENKGVGEHPGDLAMREIANRVCAVIKQSAAQK